VAATVEAGEAVTGFAAGIGHGDKRNRRIIEWAGWLIMQQVYFSHHRNRGDVPCRLVFFLAGDLFDEVTAFTRRFIGFDTGVVGREVDDIHRSAATGFGASQMLMLERLDKSMTGFAFVFGFHFF
jgi:hypothetical protein